VPPLNVKPSKRTVPKMASVRFVISTVCAPAGLPDARTTVCVPLTLNGVPTTPSKTTSK